MTEILSCGHESTPDGIAAGYARLADDSRICYSCADAMQREEMSKADEFFAYVSDRGDLTTWSGGRLANYAPNYSQPWRNNFGATMHAWSFVAPDGSRWHGRNAGPGMCIRVKRYK